MCRALDDIESGLKSQRDTRASRLNSRWQAGGRGLRRRRETRDAEGRGETRVDADRVRGRPRAAKTLGQSLSLSLSRFQRRVFILWRERERAPWAIDRSLCVCENQERPREFPRGGVIASSPQAAPARSSRAPAFAWPSAFRFFLSFLQLLEYLCLRYFRSLRSIWIRSRSVSGESRGSFPCV